MFEAPKLDEVESLENHGPLYRMLNGEADFYYPLATANWVDVLGEEHTRMHGLGVVVNNPVHWEACIRLLLEADPLGYLTEEVVKEGSVLMVPRVPISGAKYDDIGRWPISNSFPEQPMAFHVDMPRREVSIYQRENGVVTLYQDAGQNGRNCATLVAPTEYVANIITDTRSLTFEQALKAGLANRGEEELWLYVKAQASTDMNYDGIVNVMELLDQTFTYLYQPAKYIDGDTSYSALLRRVLLHVLAEAEGGSVVADWASPSLSGGAMFCISNGSFQHSVNKKWEFVHSRRFDGPLQGGPVHYVPLVKPVKD